MASCTPRPRSGRQETLKRIKSNFKKLAKREQRGGYRDDDDECGNAAREIFQDLRELTEPKSETVLKFEVIASKDLQELRDQIGDLKKKLKSEERRAEESVIEEKKIHDQIETLNTKLKELSCAKNEVENVNKRLSAMGEENNKKIDRLEAELRELGEARKKLEDEKNSIKETTALQKEGDTIEINRLKIQVEKLEVERKNLDDEKEGLEKATKLQKENDTKEIQRLESEIKKLEDFKTRNEKELETFRKELQQKETANERLENSEKKLSKNLRHSEGIVEQLKEKIQALVYENNQVKTHLEMQRNTIDRLQKALSEEKKAKDHALNRLSAAAAHRLRDQNPGITDLSDPNRPLKLAEKVSELYDNEWTNAMENLEKLDIQEENGIRILLKIIKNVFDTCMEFGDTHLESFPDLLVLPPVIFELQKERVLSVKGMSSEMLKPMKDFRKSNAEHAISRLQEFFASERKSKLHIKEKVYESCIEYIEKCVELCWMMRIQDPPIYMEAGYPTNSKFDSNKMRSYTKAGKFVHFVVWPTFFLHKDGPLLAKGVVQGSKSEIAVLESSFSSDDGNDDNENFVDAPSSSDSDNHDRSDAVTDGNQSNQESVDKLTTDTNKAPIDTARPENNGEGEDDTGLDINQPDQGNDDQSNDESDVPFDANCSENDCKGANKDIPKEKQKKTYCSDNEGNKNDDGDPDGEKSNLDNDMLPDASFGTGSPVNGDKGKDIDNDEVAGSDEKEKNTSSFTDEREIDS